MRSEPSPFKVGEENDAVDLYQALMGVEETGIWTADNEVEYGHYMNRQTWEIFLKAMSSDGERVLPNWNYT